MSSQEDASESVINTLTDEQRQRLYDNQGDNPFLQADNVYQLWWRWADFHLFLVEPTIEEYSSPVIIQPDFLPDTQEVEFVYPIHDYGSKLSTSKGDELYSAGLSMCKLYRTISKMIDILIERLKGGGIDNETEVRVAFDGHELAQREAFKMIINLRENVLVTNFDPGAWGERYLQNVKRLVDMGYQYQPRPSDHSR